MVDHRPCYTKIDRTSIEKQAYMMNSTPPKWTLVRRLGNFLLAVLIAFVLASTLATQSVVSRLYGMGVEVSLADRMGMTVQDLSGMAGSFMPMIAAGYLVAFLVVWMLCHWWPQRRTLLYVLAGATALIAIHLALKLAFGITPIAVGRSLAGLLSQGLAGAVGAWVYARRL